MKAYRDGKEKKKENEGKKERKRMEKKRKRMKERKEKSKRLMNKQWKEDRKEVRIRCAWSHLYMLLCNSVWLAETVS